MPNETNEAKAPHNGAIEVSTPVAVRKAAPMGFSPQSPDEAFRLAKMLSESALIPKALQGRPNDTLVVLMTGRELGLEPMTSLRLLHVINGRAGMAAELMVAMVLKSGLAEEFTLVSSDAKIATYFTKRVGATKGITMSFTVEEARQADLLDKPSNDTWQKYRPAKLRARASSALARAAYPDVINGLYDVDELRESFASEAFEPEPALPVSRVAQLAAPFRKADPLPPTQSDRVEQPSSDDVNHSSVPKFSKYAGQKVGALPNAQILEVLDEGQATIAKNPTSETAIKIALFCAALTRELNERKAAIAKEAGREPGSEG